MLPIVDRRLKSHFHWPLFWTVMALLLIGIANLYSATYSLFQEGVSSLMMSQIVWVLIGFIAAIVLITIDYRLFAQFAYPLYIFSTLLLLAVLFFGKTISGNRNWLQLGPFTVQPSEFAKIAFVLVMARYLSGNPSPAGYSFKELMRPLGLLLPPLLLILLGKDMGSSLFFILTFVSMILFAKVRRKTLLIILILGILGGGMGYQFVLSPHQKLRIVSFLNPERDPRGQGYHVLQSKIAVGSGEFLGKGYLKGMHNKLLYLPEKHTDFIFPVLAEEWGFLGGTLVLVLYGALLHFGLQISMKARDRFGVFLGFGITALLFWQVAINLGGVLGLMPLTGVTLPFLSYGGSSMLSLLMGVSFLLNIGMRRFIF